MEQPPPTPTLERKRAIDRLAPEERAIVVRMLARAALKAALAELQAERDQDPNEARPSAFTRRA